MIILRGILGPVLIVAAIAGNDACGGQDDLDALAQRVAGLVAQLDSDRFEIRSQAEEALETLIKQPESLTTLTQEFAKTLGDPQASFEVRSRLRAWLKRLPAAKLDDAAPKAELSIPLEQIVQETLSDSFATRSSASERLARRMRDPRAAAEVLVLLRRKLADVELPGADYDRLLTLYERARGAWLMSDPAAWKLPKTTEAEIAALVDQLAQPASTTHRIDARRTHAAARRHLLDLLCQDELVPTVKSVLEQRLAAALDEAARERLNELLEWTQPALVAEIWQGRRQIAEQHLLVGVARQSLNAMRPSHFDRIDDHRANCVSGQNLTPGEYPVGLAIAHPERPGWMCHLVNVPTPRRRMRYAYDVKRSEQQRLAEITQRTMRAYTTERAYLSDLQMLSLQELDAVTVSQMIGDYFLAVDDRRQEAGPFNLGGLNASHHGRMCYVLSLTGTHDAGPRMLEALKKQRFLPPHADDAPYDWPWIAMLAIAARDPWPGQDVWLASLLERREPLFVSPPAEADEPRIPERLSLASPELGASAAALLLERHRQVPSAFALEAVNTSILRNVGCPAYRFTTTAARQDVARWWQSQLKREGQRQNSP